MSKLLKSKFLLGVLVVATLFVGFAFNADSAAADCSITTTLRAGSVGAEVSCLQTIIGATADGKFGPMTKAAVMAWQAGHGLVADGVVGAMTRAALMGAPVAGNYPAGCTSTVGFSSTTGVKCDSGVSSGLPAGCASTTGYSSTTGAKCNGGSTPSTGGALEGGAGSITVSAKSTYNNEDVIAGDEDAKVLAFEVEADDDSDVSVTSVKVELEGGDFGAADGNSDRIEDYMDSVSIFMNGDKVGEADAEDFTENNDIYTKTISLDDAIVRAGEKEVFVVAITAASNLDSGDIDNDAFQVDVLNVRFEDADGVVTTEDTDNDNLERTFDFDDLSTSGDLELKLSEGSGNPDAQVVEVDDTTDTEVTMLEFKLKAEGSDMLVDAMLMDTLALGVDATFTDMVSDLSLEMDGDELDSVSAATLAQAAGGDTVMGTADDVAGTVLFNDLDLTIDEGDTATFKVVARIREICVLTDTACDTAGEQAVVFSQGDSFKVSFTGANLDAATTDVEDENGDSVATGDRTGSVPGEAQTFYSKGVAVTFVSADDLAVSVDGANNDRAELTLKFKVAAFGEDAFIPALATAKSFNTTATATAPTTAEGVGYGLQYTGIAADANTVTATTLTSTADEETNSFRVRDGEEETFTLKVVVQNDGTPDLAGSYRAILSGINFASTDSATGDSVYTSNLVSDYKTDYAVIND